MPIIQPFRSRRIAENVRLAWAIYSRLFQHPSHSYYLCTDLSGAEAEERSGSVCVTTVSNHTAVHIRALGLQFPGTILFSCDRNSSFLFQSLLPQQGLEPRAKSLVTTWHWIRR